jgi:rubrerythrin
MRRQATRRELMTGTAAGVLAASLAGAASANAANSAGSETQALSYALQVERVGVIAYSQVLATSVLSAGTRAQLKLLLAQERQHVAKLQQVLGALGAQVSRAPTDLAAAQAILGQHQVHLSLTDLPTERDCLRLLIDVESLTEGAYFAAIPQLQQPSLLRLGIEIMGSDAQHWTLLAGLQHGGDVSVSVPYPFVQGSS